MFLPKIQNWFHKIWPESFIVAARLFHSKWRKLKTKQSPRAKIENWPLSISQDFKKFWISVNQLQPIISSKNMTCSLRMLIVIDLGCTNQILPKVQVKWKCHDMIMWPDLPPVSPDIRAQNVQKNEHTCKILLLILKPRYNFTIYKKNHKLYIY